jgi:hypothetical protein
MFQGIVDDLGNHGILMVAPWRKSWEAAGEADLGRRGSETYAACRVGVQSRTLG